MTCPRCGAVSEAGREECPACGIIFARWEKRERKSHPSSAPPSREPVSRPHWRIAPSAPVIVGVLVLLLFGTIWTVRRHSRKAEPERTDLVDQIMRQDFLREWRARNARNGGLAQQEEQKLPASLDEAAIRNILERCTWFSTPNVVRIPRQFQRSLYQGVMEQYPGLLASQQQHIVELDPPFNPVDRDNGNPSDLINVKLTPDASQKVDVRSAGEEYELGIGRRRMGPINFVYAASGSTASIGFQWSYEKAAGNDLAMDAKFHWGIADLDYDGAGWMASRVENHSYRSNTVVCSNQR